VALGFFCQVPGVAVGAEVGTKFADLTAAMLALRQDKRDPDFIKALFPDTLSFF
jgi:hypothetical protein